MNRNSRRKHLILFVCLCLVVNLPGFALGLEFEATAETDLSMQLVQRPDVDVVLTVGNSGQDISAFEVDLLARLEELNIDPESVNIQAIETTTVSTNGVGAKAIFDTWYNYPNLNGGWAYNESTKSVGSKVNTSWTGYWKDEVTEGITMECDLAQLDRLNGSWVDNDSMGLTFRMNYEGTADYTVKGITTNLADYSYYVYITDGGGYYTPGLYKNVAGQRDAGTLLVRDNWYRRDGVWYSVKIEVNGANIVVYKKDTSTGEYVEHINYTDPDPLLAGGYGVFTSSQANGNFKNFSIVSESFKRFSEVIREPSWRESAERFVVNVDDELIGDFEDEMALSEILYRTLNEDIHYIGWGNDDNESQATAFIADNNGMGTFVNRDDTAYADAIDRIATYIVGKVAAKTKTSGTFDPDNPESVGNFIAGQPVSIQVDPSNLKTNTVTTEYPNGRWRVNQDQNFYANSFGTMWWDNAEQDDLPEAYTKPGAYDFYFEDTLVSMMNFHRQPVADFTFNSATNVITDRSYDLDSPDEDENGLGDVVAYAWKWKEVTAASSTEVSERAWTLTKPKKTDFVAGKEYIVQLRVLDAQGAWSRTTSKYISTTTTITSVPIADFSMSTDYLQKHLATSVILTDKSYDPQGASVTEWDWTISGPDGTASYSTENVILDFTDALEGDYTIQLSVKNAGGTESEVYTKSLTVVDDLIDPTVSVDPVEGSTLMSPFELVLSFVDEGGSGFKRQLVTLVNTTTEETTSLGWSSAKEKTVTLDEDGIWNVVVVAEDQKGNTTNVTYRGYKVDATAPSVPVITGAPSGWTSDHVVVSFGGSIDASAITYKYAISAETPNDEAWVTGTSKSLTSAGNFHIWTRAIDAVGNESETADVWVRIDKTAPVFSSMPADRAMSIYDPYSQDTAVANDPESGLNGGVTANANAVKTGVIGRYEVVYSATNTAGLTATEKQYITVADQTKPVLALNGESSVDVEVHTSYTDAGATATDNYESDALITGKIVPSDNINLHVVETYAVTYNVTDAGGNAALPVTRTVKVVDTTKPVLSLKGEKAVDVEVHTSYTDAGASATDNYDEDTAISTTITSTNDIDLHKVGPYTVTYQVTDANGNAAEPITRTVNVVDTTKPVLSLKGAPSVDVEVHGSYTDAGAKATDNYDDDVALSVTITSTNDIDLHKVGPYTVTYQLTDANGNAAEPITRTVNVVDTTIPVITVSGTNPVDTEVHLSYLDAGATAIDNYDSDSSITAAIQASDDLNLHRVGPYTVTYNATDINGNKAAPETRRVNVVDTTKPVLSLKGERAVDVEVHTSYTDAGASATDNYDEDTAISATITSTNDIDLHKVGPYTVTYQVTDANGNAAELITRTVNVVDTTIPVIQVEGSNPVDTEVHLSYLDAGATATDNYDSNEAITAAIEASDNLNLHVVGPYTVTYKVMDANGNKAALETRRVNVVDTTKPVITLKGEPSVDVEVHTSYTDAGAKAIDNYDDDTAISATIAATNNINLHIVGPYTVTYNVSDVASNAAVTITRDVNVVDTTKPDLNLLGEAEIFMDQGDPYTDAGASATDNYDSDASITGAIRLTNPLDVNAIGVYTLTYEVTDVNSNTAEPIERTVHVVHPLAVTTSEVDQVSSTGGTLKGIVDHYGVKPVAEHGFVFDRNIDKMAVDEAEGLVELGAVASTGRFEAEVKLSPGSIYYVRAYAVKAEGVVYGEIVEVITPSKAAKPVAVQTFGDISVATVNPDRLAGQIKTGESGETVLSIETQTLETSQQFQLPLSAVDQINEIAAGDGGEPVAGIRTEIGTMDLPTQELGSASLMPEGFVGDAESARLHVTIERVAEEERKAMEEASGEIGLVEPVRFEVELKVDRVIDERTTYVETTPIDGLEHVVRRTLAAPDTEAPLMAMIFDETAQEWMPVLSRTVVDENGEKSVEILHREMGVYTLVERKPVEILGLEGSDAKEAIEILASMSVLPCEAGTKYEPTMGITRAEMAYTMVRLMGITQAEDEVIDYPDTAEHRFEREIQLATQSGIFTGYGDGLFRGDQIITREELAAVIERAVEYVEMTKDLNEEKANEYGDSELIDFWSFDSIGRLTDAGVIDAKEGDHFRPQAKATKAQAATMLANFLKMIGMY